jgi:hypothetical protein
VASFYNWKTILLRTVRFGGVAVRKVVCSEACGPVNSRGGTLPLNLVAIRTVQRNSKQPYKPIFSCRRFASTLCGILKLECKNVETRYKIYGHAFDFSNAKPNGFCKKLLSLRCLFQGGPRNCWTLAVCWYDFCLKTLWVKRKKVRLLRMLTLLRDLPRFNLLG